MILKVKLLKMGHVEQTQWKYKAETGCYLKGLNHITSKAPKF